MPAPKDSTVNAATMAAALSSRTGLRLGRQSRAMIKTDAIAPQATEGARSSESSVNAVMPTRLPSRSSRYASSRGSWPKQRADQFARPGHDRRHADEDERQDDPRRRP